MLTLQANILRIYICNQSLSRESNTLYRVVALHASTSSQPRVKAIFFLFCPEKKTISKEIKYLNIKRKYSWIYNNYSMSPSWIWSDKITNERVAQVGYNHFISNKGKWKNCFRKFSNRVLPPIFISTILQSVRKENLAHYFPYDVKLGLLAHSRSFLANQKARNAIVGAENLLKIVNHRIFW